MVWDDEKSRPKQSSHKDLHELAAGCVALGLHPDILDLHQRRIREHITRPERYFPIESTCTLENGGIVPLALLPSGAGTYEHAGVVALVPSAGAASRYVAPLEPISQAAQTRDTATLAKALRHLKNTGAEQWALPPLLHRLIEAPDAAAALAPAEWEFLSGLAEMPKALFPCTVEGSSFLQLKIREHRAIGGFSAQVFVTPPSAPQRFAEALSDPKTSVEKDVGHAPILFEEQCGRLSTLRFRADGSPFLGNHDTPSCVPAGHGALTRLFEDVRNRVEGAATLFIRNIDNVCGTGAAPVQATRALLSAHTELLACIKCIRKHLQNQDLAAAATSAQPLRDIALALPDSGSFKANQHQQDDGTEALWWILERLFHTRREDLPGDLTEHAALTWAYSRPFNFLGQVANSGKDVGGTPVFLAQAASAERVSTDDPVNSILARTRKLCIELPHASAEDAEKFLRNPKLATHFNPVFIAAEIPADATWYDGGYDRIKLNDQAENSSHPFWLVAKKSWHGETVFYHESLLSEVLGNSIMTNFMFVEIPRSLFNPHKSLADGAGRHDTDWI